MEVNQSVAVIRSQPVGAALLSQEAFGKGYEGPFVIVLRQAEVCKGQVIAIPQTKSIKEAARGENCQSGPLGAKAVGLQVFPPC